MASIAYGKTQSGTHHQRQTFQKLKWQPEGEEGDEGEEGEEERLLILAKAPVRRANTASPTFPRVFN